MCLLLFSVFSHHLESPEWLWISLFNFAMPNTSSTSRPNHTLPLYHSFTRVFPPVCLLRLFVLMYMPDQHVGSIYFTSLVRVSLGKYSAFMDPTDRETSRNIINHVFCVVAQCVSLLRVHLITGVTVWACMRFACVIRSGYLVLANHHTSSKGQGSRDLRQTRVEPYWIEIVGHSSTKHQFSLPLRIFNRL